MAHLPKVCEYIHLPAQSGSNKVLERMGRGYSREEYLDKVAMIKDHLPSAALTSDFIVGFPGEEEEDFLLTLDLIEKVRYEGVFAFRYSVREGTRAARWPDNVPLAVKRQRLAQLLDLQDTITEELSRGYEGAVREVLFSSWQNGTLEGRTRTNKIVVAEGGPSYQGKIAKVKITEGKRYKLTGIILEGGESTWFA